MSPGNGFNEIALCIDVATGQPRNRHSGSQNHSPSEDFLFNQRDIRHPSCHRVPCKLLFRSPRSTVPASQRSPALLNMAGQSSSDSSNQSQEFEQRSEPQPRSYNLLPQEQSGKPIIKVAGPESLTCQTEFHRVRQSSIDYRHHTNVGGRVKLLIALEVTGFGPFDSCFGRTYNRTGDRPEPKIGAPNVVRANGRILDSQNGHNGHPRFRVNECWKTAFSV